RVIDSGAATEPSYSPALGYGYLEQGQPDLRPTCGAGIQSVETLRQSPDGKILYRFDHLQTNRFYQVQATLYECDGAGRQETITIDGVTPSFILVDGAGRPGSTPVNLGDGASHRVSVKLDRELQPTYADHSIVVAIESGGLDGAVVSDIALQELD